MLIKLNLFMLYVFQTSFWSLFSKKFLHVYLDQDLPVGKKKITNHWYYKCYICYPSENTFINHVAIQYG